MAEKASAVKLVEGNYYFPPRRRNYPAKADFYCATALWWSLLLTFLTVCIYYTVDIVRHMNEFSLVDSGDSNRGLASLVIPALDICEDTYGKGVEDATVSILDQVQVFADVYADGKRIFFGPEDTRALSYVDMPGGYNLSPQLGPEAASPSAETPPSPPAGIEKVWRFYDKFQDTPSFANWGGGITLRKTSIKARSPRESSIYTPQEAPRNVLRQDIIHLDRYRCIRAEVGLKGNPIGTSLRGVKYHMRFKGEIPKVRLHSNEFGAQVGGLLFRVSAADGTCTSADGTCKKSTPAEDFALQMESLFGIMVKYGCAREAKVLGRESFYSWRSGFWESTLYDTYVFTTQDYKAKPGCNRGPGLDHGTGIDFRVDFLSSYVESFVFANSWHMHVFLGVSSVLAMRVLFTVLPALFTVTESEDAEVTFIVPVPKLGLGQLGCEEHPSEAEPLLG